MSREKLRGEGKSLGIYVHIPFCVKKCDYCDFLSMPAAEETQDRYMDALLLEIEAQASLAKGSRVDSIFIGGGTPSVLKAHRIGQVLDMISKHYPLSEGLCAQSADVKLPGQPQGQLGKVEVTVECNPGTLTEEKVRAYAQAGVNRISIGLQSADDGELRLLGRIHTWEQFLESVQLVRNYFTDWNVDVMSALPGQSLDSYRRTLEQVLALEPPHISAYSLIIEEGTPFYDRYETDNALREQGRKPCVLPDEEAERNMYELTLRLLNEHGYHRYEISNYARNGYECRHNNRYWMREDYLGLGLGASSCMGNVRWHNASDMEEYLQQADCMSWGKKDEQILTKSQQMEETMFLGLRRMQGVDCEAFEQVFGQSVEAVYGETLKKLKLQELVKHSGKYIQLTQFGIDVSNYVLAQFLLD